MFFDPVFCTHILKNAIMGADICFMCSRNLFVPAFKASAREISQVHFLQGGETL